MLFRSRDPIRSVPLGDDILVSPADGIITNITEKKIGKKNYIKISLFELIFIYLPGFFFWIFKNPS